MTGATTNHRSRARRGYLILDVVTGLFLFSVFATVFAIGLTARSRGATGLHDLRIAQRAAETALMDAQSGRQIPVLENVTIKIHDETGNAPSGQHWVRVEAIYNGHATEIVGLAPIQTGGAK